MKTCADDIFSKATDQLIGDIENKRYTVSDLISGKKPSANVRMRAALLRFAFNVIWFFKNAGDKSHRDNRRIARAVSEFAFSIAPARVTGVIPATIDSLVIEYNYQSIGDIFRLVAYSLDNYTARQNYFVIDLISFELIAPIIPKLKRLNVNFVPLITEDNYYEMNTSGFKDVRLNQLKESLHEYFIRRCYTASRDGSIVWVPHDTTGCGSIFSSKDEFDGVTPVKTSTISDIFTVTISNDSEENHLGLMAACVLPGSDYFGYGINFFSKYRICLGEIYDAPMIKRFLGYSEPYGRYLDHAVLRSISRSLSALNAGEYIY